MDKLSSHLQSICKEIISSTFSKSGPSGGIQFDLDADKFDSQRLVHMLPKLLLVPFEVLLGMCTESLSEGNKNLVVGMMTDTCCRQFENFIIQVNIYFA
jgi:hypothetical protein